MLAYSVKLGGCAVILRSTRIQNAMKGWNLAFLRSEEVKIQVQSKQASFARTFIYLEETHHAR